MEKLHTHTQVCAHIYVSKILDRSVLVEVVRTAIFVEGQECGILVLRHRIVNGTSHLRHILLFLRKYGNPERVPELCLQFHSGCQRISKTSLEMR